jgi:hypothetical protein
MRSYTFEVFASPLLSRPANGVHVIAIQIAAEFSDGFLNESLSAPIISV